MIAVAVAFPACCSSLMALEKRRFVRMEVKCLAESVCF